MQMYLPIAGISLSVMMLVGVGLAVGILSGMFGVGGGFILTPILMVLGVSPIVAVGTGAAIVVASSVSGAYAQWRRGNVDIHLGLVLLVSGLLGSSIGLQIQRVLKSIGQLDLFTSLTYAGILLLIGHVMLAEGLWAWYASNRDTRLRKPSQRRRGWVQTLPLRFRFRRSKMYISVIPPILIGMFVGLLTAIMGAGGGFILIPLLLYVLGINTRLALGTSSFQVIFVTAFTTVMQAIVNHNVDVLLGLPLMVAAVVGAQWGVRIGANLKAEQLRVALALLVLAVGVRMLVDLTTPPSDLFSITVPRGF